MNVPPSASELDFGRAVTSLKPIVDHLAPWLKREIWTKGLTIHEIGPSGGYLRAALSLDSLNAPLPEDARRLQSEIRAAAKDRPAPAPRATADVVFTTRFDGAAPGWRDALTALPGNARHLVVMSRLPREALDADAEWDGLRHTTAPLRFGSFRLAHVAALEMTHHPVAEWDGHHCLAIWSRETFAAPGEPPKIGSADRLDLRFVPDESVPVAMALAQADYARFAAADAALRFLDEEMASRDAERAAAAAIALRARAGGASAATEANGLRNALAHVAVLVDEHNARVQSREQHLNHRVLVSIATYDWFLAHPVFRRAMAIANALRAITGGVHLPPRPESYPVELDRMPRPATLHAIAATAAEPRLRASRGGPCILMQVATLDSGGVEQVIYDLASGFAARGLRVVTLVVDSGGATADRMIAAGAEVVVLNGFAPDRYRGAIERLDVRVAIVHHCYSGLDLLALRRIPVVEIVHNYYHWNRDGHDDLPRLSLAVTRHVAVSSGVADYHARTFGVPRDAIAVIPNPAHGEGLLRPERALLERFRADWRESFRFVNVAQFFPAKSQPLLVSAFARVRKAVPHARLALCGQFSDPQIKATVDALIAEHGLAEAVDMPGFLDRRSLSRVLARGHVFVQPSIYEGWSVALAEAAHFALPLIATRVGGAVDVIRDDDCGIVIPASFDALDAPSAEIYARGRQATQPNLDALVAAMTTMAQNYEAWAPRGYVGQARIDGYGLSEAIDKYLAVLAEVGGVPATAADG